MLLEGQEIIKEILSLLLTTPDTAFLIHCSMGKDQIGVVFAILLSLAGVSADVVAEEYSRSYSCLRETVPGIAAAIKKATVQELTDKEALGRAEVMIRTDKEAMVLTLRIVEERFGGVMQYLNGYCGVAVEELSQLQDILTYTRS
ncbi:protein-tyrosine phosphatase-like protein [Aspergillus crustosus]